MGKQILKIILVIGFVIAVEIGAYLFFSTRVVKTTVSVNGNAHFNGTIVFFRQAGNLHVEINGTVIGEPERYFQFWFIRDSTMFPIKCSVNSIGENGQTYVTCNDRFDNWPDDKIRFFVWSYSGHSKPVFSVAVPTVNK